jgi:hypothetical protein
VQGHPREHQFFPAALPYLLFLPQDAQNIKLMVCLQELAPATPEMPGPPHMTYLQSLLDHQNPQLYALFSSG